MNWADEQHAAQVDGLKKMIELQRHQIETLTSLNQNHMDIVRAYRAKDAWLQAARENPDEMVALLESDDCPLLPPGWEFQGIVPMRSSDPTPVQEQDEPPHVLRLVAEERGLS